MTAKTARRLWPVLVASGLAFVILVSLGLWQVQRLAWKQGLIDAIDRAVAAEPILLDEAVDQFLAGKPVAFAKVKATGRFAPRDPLRVLTSSKEGPSWTLVHGFQQINGKLVLVNRGKIGHDRPMPPWPKDLVDIVGLVHRHDKGQGWFDVANDPVQNRWYWWDVVAMSNEFPATHHSPNNLVIDLLPGSPGTEGLLVDPPKANLRNNHLGYAMTWFGLAAVLVVMTGMFVRGRLHA